MTRPTRETTAGRVYLDLRKRARAEGRGTDELLVLYVLERFLYRLSISVHRDRLVLKGGMLLAVFEERRPTRDVDLLGMAIANDVESVAALVTEITAIEVDDGVVFRPEQLTTQTIREQDVYAAVRVTMPATVATAEVALKVDVNVGDPVTPAPVEVTYPALLDEPFTMIGYPLETVLAEKLVTMIARGDTTTRDRDFADVWLLTGHHRIGRQQVARGDHRHRRPPRRDPGPARGRPVAVGHGPPGQLAPLHRPDRPRRPGARPTGRGDR